MNDEITYADLIKQYAELEALAELLGEGDYVFLMHPDSYFPIRHLIRKIKRFQKRRWIQGRWTSHYYSGNKVRSRKR